MWGIRTLYWDELITRQAKISDGRQGMSLSRRLLKPHYLFRPSQVVRRANGWREHGELTTMTPWHSELQVMRDDAVSAGILRTGVHELAVSEVVWRLTTPDDFAIDVGANIGYFTSLLSCRAQRVIALEPNPQLVDCLRANVQRWGPLADRVTLDFRAASDVNGSAKLHFPSGYDHNRGTASIEVMGDGAGHDVLTVRPDDVIRSRRVGILKMDVEGHEAAVLRGADKSLARGLIRDLIFEDHEPFPTSVSRRLTDAGFTIFGIRESLMGPVLVDPLEDQRTWDAPTYLATLATTRAVRLLSPRRWRCLRPRG